MEIKLTSHWTELLQLLITNEVDFTVIGAFALAAHGISRMTGDLDLLYDPSPANCERLPAALRESGVPVVGLNIAQLCEPDSTVSFGRPPARIDLLNWLSGSDWADVAADRVRGPLGEFEVWYISRRAYLKNKLAAARPQDLADARRLQELYSDQEG